MTTAEQVLAIARAEIGIAEGPGSNNVKYNTWYYGHPVIGDQYAWCAVFVSWVMKQAGAEAIAVTSAYCPSVVAMWQAKGAWGSTPRVGAQVVYEWPSMGRPCHTGIVEAITSDGIVAIEGNTDVAGGRSGGRVMRQHRTSKIVGYGYPAYDGITIPAPATPHGLVVDGQFGPATCVALQMALHVAADGQFGPITKRALQGRVGSAQDGDIGPNTIRAMQRYVSGKGFPTAVDGQLGPNTWSAVQRCLNAGTF